MNSNSQLAPIDRLPPDVRAIVDSLTKVLGIYMGHHFEIEMHVGRTTKAKLTITGGPINREVLSDVMAHLAFYRKYFPKEGEPSGYLDTPEKILETLALSWEEHRTALRGN